MKLLALAGLAGSGKDTAAQALIEDGWTHLKFADPIWDCLIALDVEVFYRGCYVKLNGVIEMLGREEAKRQIPAVRRYLQRIGSEMGRGVLGKDIWVECMANRLLEMPDDSQVVISDCRFDNEADMVRKLDGQVLLVRRPGTSQMDHQSEALDFDMDGVILNAGAIEDLHDAIRMCAK